MSFLFPFEDGEGGSFVLSLVARMGDVDVEERRGDWRDILRCWRGVGGRLDEGRMVLL